MEDPGAVLPGALGASSTSPCPPRRGGLPRARARTHRGDAGGTPRSPGTSCRTSPGRRSEVGLGAPPRDQECPEEIPADGSPVLRCDSQVDPLEESVTPWFSEDAIGALGAEHCDVIVGGIGHRPEKVARLGRSKTPARVHDESLAIDDVGRQRSPRARRQRSRLLRLEACPASRRWRSRPPR